MATFVIVHGAFGGGWEWTPAARALREVGHVVFTPTLTGMGEHDADRGTLDLLLHFARNLQGTRLLIIGTYRDVEVDRAHPLSATLAELRRAQAFLRVPLRGLSPDEVHRMMSNIRGQDVSHARAEAVWRQTEGNPLFVQEVLRYLVEAGLVVREGDHYVRTDGRPDEAGIPEGLRDVIGKRLSRLSPETNALLAIAAVQGRDFRLDVLQTVAKQPAEVIEAALEEAAERAIVEERPGVGTLAFRFTHAFFRQTLYEELFAARRLRLHQQVGQALEEAYGRRADDHAGELAEHFAQSTDPVDLERARSYAETAAARALAVYAYGDAARELERALRLEEVLDPEDSAKRLELLLELGDALLLCGEPDRVKSETGPHAYDLAQQLGRSPEAARASVLVLESFNALLGTAAWAAPEFPRWVGRAQRTATPGTYESVRADLAQASITLRTEGLERAWELVQRSLATARACDEPRAFASAAFIALSFIPAAQPDQRLALALEAASRQTHATFVGVSLMAGCALIACGEPTRGRDLWQRLRDSAERTRLPTAIVYSISTAIAEATLSGRLEDATKLAEEAVSTAESLGIPTLGWQTAAQWPASAHLWLGSMEEVIPRYESAFPAGGSAPSPLAQAVAAAALARVGLRDEAGKLFQTLFSAFRWAPLGGLDWMLETALALEDPSAARNLAAALAASAGMACGTIVSFAPARLLAEEALLRQANAEARAYFEQAIEVTSRAQFRPEVALSCLGLAEVLLAHYPEEHSDAIEHLDFAIGEFQAMKMQPALERALRSRDLLNA